MPGSRGDISAGRAFVELFVKQGSWTQGLNSARAKLLAWAKSASEIGSVIRGVGVRAAALGASIAAPLGFAVKASSDLEETMNKFVVVFGDAAGAMQEWGDTFGEQVGRSQRQVRDFLAGTQDLLVPLGFAADSAGEMSKQITTLAVDLASFNNMADADTLRDLHAALTGSGEVMKKYGVIVSEAAVKQELLNQGMDPKVATEQAKVQARLNIILRGTTAAQGDALRSAGGFANQMKALQARVENLAGEVGGALLPVVTPLVGIFGNATKAAGLFIAENKGLVVAVAGAAVALTGLGLAGIAFGTILSGLGTIAGAMAALLNPIGLVAAALVAGVAAWMRYTESGRAAAASLMGAFGPVLETARSTLGGIYDALASGDLALAGKIAGVGLKTALLQGLQGLQSIIGGTWGKTVASIGGSLLSGDFQGAWQTGIKAMAAAWSQFSGWVVSIGTGFAKKVVQVWGTATSNIAQSLIEWASSDNAMGRALDKILNLGNTANFQEEVKRAAKLQEQLLSRGLNGGGDPVEEAKAAADDQIRGMEQAITDSIDGFAESFELAAEKATSALDAHVTTGADGLSDEIAASVAELDRLRAEAAKAAEDRRAAAAAAAAGAGPGEVAAGKGGSLGKATVASTFSAAALSLLGGGGGRDPVAREVAAHRKVAERTERTLERIENKLVPRWA